MNIGISLGCSPREPLAHSVEILREADRLGVDMAWIIDSQLIMKDPYAIMALASTQTERIKFGTGVTNPATRHPTITASVATALKELSNDRYIIGIGSGDSALQPLGKKPCTLKHTEKTIRFIRDIMEGQTSEFEGAEIALKTHRGKVPVYVAASQPGMLRLSGRIADGVIIMGVADPEITMQQINLIKEGAEEVGRRLEDLELDLWVTMSCQEDTQQAIEDVKSWSASQARWLYRWENKPSSMMRFAEELEAAAQAYDFSEHLSLRAKHKDSVSDDFARTVAVAGDVDHCVGRLKELAELGLHRVTITLLSGNRINRLRVLMEQIAPQLG